MTIQDPTSADIRLQSCVEDREPMMAEAFALLSEVAGSFSVDIEESRCALVARGYSNPEEWDGLLEETDRCCAVPRGVLVVAGMTGEDPKTVMSEFLRRLQKEALAQEQREKGGAVSFLLRIDDGLAQWVILNYVRSLLRALESEISRLSTDESVKLKHRAEAVKIASAAKEAGERLDSEWQVLSVLPPKGAGKSIYSFWRDLSFQTKHERSTNKTWVKRMMSDVFRIANLAFVGPQAVVAEAFVYGQMMDVQSSSHSLLGCIENEAPRTMRQMGLEDHAKRAMEEAICSIPSYSPHW